MGGNYLDFSIDRDAIARYGLTVGDVQDVIQTAIGGMDITTTVEGLERYPVNLRYSRDFRDDIPVTRIGPGSDAGRAADSAGAARVGEVCPRAARHQERRRRPNAWIYVDLRGHRRRHLRAERQKRAWPASKIKLPTGYTIVWSGQYEYMQRAKQRLMFVIPLTIVIIFVIIFLNTKSLIKTAIVLLAVPFSLVGAIWLIYLLGYNMSVAVWVGIIALAGLDAETGVVMLLYLDQAYEDFKERGVLNDRNDLARFHLCRRREAGPAEGHDYLRDRGRSCAHPVEPGSRRRRHEAHRHANGRRRGHIRHHGTGNLSDHLFPLAKPASAEGRTLHRVPSFEGNIMKHIVLCCWHSARYFRRETFPAKLEKPLWPDRDGTVEINDQGITYTAPHAKHGPQWLGVQHVGHALDRLDNRPHSLSWKWDDIQYFDRISPQGIRGLDLPGRLALLRARPSSTGSGSPKAN